MKYLKKFEAHSENIFDKLKKYGEITEPSGGISISGQNYCLTTINGDQLFFKYEYESKYPFGVVLVSAHGLSNNIMTKKFLLQDFGTSRTLGKDNFLHDVNYNPYFLNENEFMELVDYVSAGWKRYAKDFADFYRDKEKD